MLAQVTTRYYRFRLIVTDSLMSVKLFWTYNMLIFSMYYNFWSEKYIHFPMLLFMVFNTTFNNISVTSWWSIVLMKETGVPGENHRPTPNYWQALSHTVVSVTPRLSSIITHNCSDDRHCICICTFFTSSIGD